MSEDDLAKFQKVMREIALAGQPISFDIVFGGIGNGNVAEEIESRRVLVDAIHNSSNNPIEIQLDDGPEKQKYHNTVPPGETLPLHGMPFNHGIRVAVFNVGGNDTTYANTITVHGRIKKL